MIIDFDVEQPSKVVAALLSLSDRQVRRLAEEGRIPSMGDNKFMALDCIHAYLDFKKARDKSGPIEIDGEFIDGDKEKARKTKLEADKLQDEQNLRREEWAPIAEMEPEWLRQFRSVLELAQETVDDIKSRVDLTAEQIEEIDVAFATGMNRIAESE